MGGKQTRDILYGVPVSEATETESEIFRHPQAIKKLHTTFDPEVSTIYDGLKRTFRRWADRPFLGSRSQEPDGKYGPFIFMTYAQIDDITSRVANKLAAICPRRQINGYNMSSLCVWAKNRPDVAILDIAAERQNITVIPIMDSLTPDQIAGVLVQTEVEVAVVSNDTCERLVKFLAMYTTQIKHLITFGPISTKLQNTFKRLKIQVCEFQALSKLEPVADNPPSPNDIATLTYTSGSSGNPKLVVLTHKALLASATGAMTLGISHKPRDVAISYMSYAHLFERSLFTIYKISGCAIGFATSAVTMMQDIAVLKPTCFHCAPRLYNYLYDRFNKAIEELPSFQKCLTKANLSYKYKKLLTAAKFDTFDVNFVKEIRKVLGGNLRFLLSWSAPIRPEVVLFFKAVMKCPFIESYGLSETSGLASATRVTDLNMGHQGGPTPNLEIKLVDLPELGFTTRDIVDGSLARRGEIYIRGPVTVPHYFGTENSNIRDSNGWVRTGDIGQILEHGQIVVIDRRKSAFKLAQGEYIFPERLETIFSSSPYIEQIFINGDPLEAFPVAIVVPNKGMLNFKFPDISLQQMCELPAATKLVLQELAQIAKAKRLRSYEKVQQVLLVAEAFTTENGLLTATWKLNRPFARKHFENELKLLYKHG